MRLLPFPAALKPLGFLFFLAIFTAPLHADDGFFIEDGSTVYPSPQTQVRRVSETISLKRDQNDVQAQSDAVFLSADSDADVVMGFPAELSFTPPRRKGKKDKTPQAAIGDFTVALDGQKTDPELEPVTNKLKLKGLVFHRAFLWKVHLLKGKPLHVQHTYHFAAVENPIPGRYKVTDYAHSISCFLTPGNLWAGVPDTVEVTLDLGKEPPDGMLEAFPAGFTEEKGVLHWTWKGSKPTGDLKVTVHSAYPYEISESYLKQYLGAGRPSSDKQQAFSRLDALEKSVIKNRARMSKECMAQNIALIESFERRLEKE